MSSNLLKRSWRSLLPPFWCWENSRYFFLWLDTHLPKDLNSASPCVGTSQFPWMSRYLRRLPNWLSQSLAFWDVRSSPVLFPKTAFALVLMRMKQKVFTRGIQTMQRIKIRILFLASYRWRAHKANIFQALNSLPYHNFFPTESMTAMGPSFVFLFPNPYWTCWQPMPWCLDSPQTSGERRNANSGTWTSKRVIEISVGLF